MSYLSASCAVRKGPEKKTSFRRGMGFLPQTHVLKNLFDDRTLVDGADDVHFARALTYLG